MSYVDNNLVAGERVMYRAHLHWKIFHLTVVFGVLALIAVTLGFLIKPPTPDATPWLFYVAGGCVVLALLVFALAWIKYRSSEFAVTDKRVIIKTGLLNRHSMETLLTKVENIGVDQTLWGRMFGYGTIHVTGTGGTTERFADIANPLEFRKQVQAETITYDERRNSGNFPREPTAAAALPRDERDCPYCAERILAKATVCRFCGREVPAAV